MFSQHHFLVSLIDFYITSGSVVMPSGHFQEYILHLIKHQVCQFPSLQNKIGNTTQTRKRAWEEDCACQLHSETSLQGSTPILQSMTPLKNSNP